MLELLDIVARREALAHTGFLLVALAFVVRDPLTLRLRAILAYCFFTAFAASAPGHPIWELIGWYLAFLVINCVQVALLVYERKLDRLSPDEERLIALAFPALDRCAAKRLIRRGEWRVLPRGTLLTEQGQPPTHVCAILDGRIAVAAGGTLVCTLAPGQFVGEIGFIKEAPATATAVVASDSARVIAWDQATLRRGMRRDGDLRASVLAALGSDLARKIADHTAQADGDEGPGDPSTAAADASLAA